MGMLDEVRLARRRMLRQERAWPVGQGELLGPDAILGHDQSEFSPESYGEYAATSNEVYSAASLRARLMSGLSLNLFQGRGAEKSAANDSPAAKLLRYVNPFWTWPRLARMDELSMCTWGQSFWAIERDSGGIPKEIWWVKPSRMRPVPHESGYLEGFLYQSVSGQQIPFRPDEVVWFRYPNLNDEFSPLSPLSAARLAADTAHAMMTSNNNLFKNGMQVGGLIVPATDKVSFSPEQAEDLSKQLEKRLKGVDKAHRWAVLRYEAQFKQMNITPKDAEFIMGINLTLRQVCNAYGIPSPLLNDLEHATLANVRDLMRGFWENTLVSDANLRAAEIEEQFLPMFRRQRGADHVAYDFSSVPSLQESSSESWARERQAIEVGALTINEWRESKGMPPVEWGNVYWAQVNRTPVDGPDMPHLDAPTEVPPAPVAETADERAFRQILASFGPPTLNGHRR